MRKKSPLRILCLFFTATLLCVSVSSCIFSPAEGERKPNPPGKWQDPISPGIVIKNLEVSFSNLDIDFYERCLNPDYSYENISEIDSLNVSWSRSTDIRTVGNVFKNSISFVFTPDFQTVVEEYGENVPDIPTGAITSKEHPDDIWYRFNYAITMDISLKVFGEYRINQFMTFVMVQDSSARWSIIRWIDSSQLSQ